MVYTMTKKQPSRVAYKNLYPKKMENVHEYISFILFNFVETKTKLT